MTLDELHKAVQRCIATATGRSWGTDYRPLADRLDAVKRGAPGNNAAALEADLHGLLEASADVLRRMVQQQATSARCHSPHAEATLRQVAASSMQQQLAAASRPRMSPVELVQSLAARGVTLSAGEGGTLRAVPADLLAAADLDVLRAYKSAILDVLAAPAAVV